MKNFVRGLIFDLRNRCDILLAEIEEPKVHADLREYAERVRGRIGLVKENLHILTNRLESRAADYSVRNVFFEFKERSNEIQSHEYISIPSITRYGGSDIYFNRLLRLSCEQMGYPLAIPVGSTLGQAYYYSYPSHGVILGPLLQAHSFLNLPDLYHEIGHFVFDEYRRYFDEPFAHSCRAYFSEQRAQEQRKGGADNLTHIISQIEQKWLGDWLGEFACDIVATYVVGDAYAWANFYLCAHTHSSDNVFMPGLDSFSVVHPSDESRMRAVLSTLKIMEPANSLKDLEEEWSEYKDTLSPDKPDFYDFFYPDQLLQELAQIVIDRCKEIGLRDYISSKKTDQNPNIVRHIDEAWTKFRSEPDSFVAWEREKLAIVKSQLSAG